MAGAAAFTQMMADATPMGMKDTSASMTLTWPEPLKPQSGAPVTRINTLFRSADVHNRVLRMAELYFTRGQMNELKQMIGMAVGGGRYVEPTWTLAEGQAIMAVPGFAEKLQKEGVAAFYDYVFTIDWLIHRIETLESLLSLLGDTQRSSPDEIRFLQTQLDAVLMSPHGMPWYMWEREGVQRLLTPDPTAPDSKLADSAGPYVQLLTGQRKLQTVPDPFDAFVKQLENGSAFKGAVPQPLTPSSSLNAIDELLPMCLAAQEAVLLTSPLWNDLIALGQGLYRVQLTRNAQTELGLGGGSPIDTGAWINTFRAGQPVWNQFPSADPAGSSPDRSDVTLINAHDFVPVDTSVNTNACIFGSSVTVIDDAVSAAGSNPRRGNLARALQAAHLLTPTLIKESKSTSSTIKPKVSASGDSTLSGSGPKLLDEAKCIAAFLQPKTKDCAVYAACGLGLYFSAADLTALEAEFVAAGDKLDVLRRRCLTHSGSGGAIASYVCTGVGVRGTLAAENGNVDTPLVLRVTPKILEACIKRMPEGHPTKWMPKLWDAMQKAVTYDAADVKRQQLDPSVRLDRPARTLIDYARGRIKDLEMRYGALRNGRANLPLHPLATAQDLFSPEYSTGGVLSQHRALPQCPVGTVPLIFDTVRRQRLTPQQWQKQVVEVNGQKMLPDTLEVQACLPGRPVNTVMGAKPQ
jgi:hypothetical protein